MMADLELCYMSALEARNRIRDRVLSPVDLAKALIQRIEELNPAVSCAILIPMDERELQE